jgi:hypothetical protein
MVKTKTPKKQRRPQKPRKPRCGGGDEGWVLLWQGIGDLLDDFGDRLVFIGGIAVYLHVVSVKSPETFVQTSHDGDFLISLYDYTVLSDIEEVVINRRLMKHQIVKRGIEFDVYLEHNNRLRVPFSEAAAASSVVLSPMIGRPVRVASPEHLLILKLDAYMDRRGRTKGKKDERDVIRLAYVMTRTGGVRRDLIVSHLTDEMIEVLVELKRSSEFLSLAGAQAQDLRRSFSAVVDEIVGRREV